MRTAIRTAMVEDGYKLLTPLMTNHPKDRHVLAVAVFSQSEFIVTENLRDFPPASLALHGLQAISADDFLCMLAERDPQSMISVAQARAAKMRNPPRTFDQMLDQLGMNVPRTVAVMRQARGSA